MKPIKASRIALILLLTPPILLSAGGCKKAPNGNSSAPTLKQTSANAAPAPTVSPVEAWVVSEKQTYREGDTIALTLRLVNRTNNTVRLPVPIVCTDVTGWGELRLDLFINGRKYGAACHVPEAMELESDGELTRRIISRRFDVPVGKSPWNTAGHFTVYAVWQRKDISKQTDNDFLGPLVSHPAEFDIVASKPKKTPFYSVGSHMNIFSILHEQTGVAIVGWAVPTSFKMVCGAHPTFFCNLRDGFPLSRE